MDHATTDRIKREIENLLVAYWWEVDLNGGENAHSYYVEDATFETSLKKRTGRSEIAAFYRERRERGARLSRHVVSNVHVEVHDDDSATCRWVLMLYAADGVPVLPADLPNMIADGLDVCVREADGVWRYRSRSLIPLFKSAVPTTG